MQQQLRTALEDRMRGVADRHWTGAILPRIARTSGGGPVIADMLPSSRSSLTFGEYAMLVYWCFVHSQAGDNASRELWTSLCQSLATGVESEARAWAMNLWNEVPAARGTQFAILDEVQSRIGSAQDRLAYANIVLGDSNESTAGIAHFVSNGMSGRVAQWFRGQDTPVNVQMSPMAALEQAFIVNEGLGNAQVPPGPSSGGSGSPGYGGGSSPWGGINLPDFGGMAGPGGYGSGSSTSDLPNIGMSADEDTDDEDRLIRRGEMASLIAALARWGPYAAPILKVVLMFVIELVWIIIRNDALQGTKSEAISRAYGLVDRAFSVNAPNRGPVSTLKRWLDYWTERRY